MNKKQMARLLEGVIDECVDLEIEIMQEKYIKRLKEEWV